MTESTDNNLLSRSQLKQLLAKAKQNVAVEEPDVEAATYDWYRPHHFSPTHHTALVELREYLTSTLAETLGVLCNAEFQVEVENMTEQFAGSLVKEYDQKGVNFYLTLGKNKTKLDGLITIPKTSAVGLVTKMLQDPMPAEPETHEFSQLEASMLADMACGLTDALKTTLVKFDLAPLEAFLPVTNEEWPIEVPEFEEFVKISFNTESDGQKLEASFIMLSTVFDSFLDITTPTGVLSDDQLQKTIVSHLNDIPVPVKAQLGSALISMADVMALEAGDIMLLNKKVSEPIEIVVDGKPFFRGQPAKSQNRYAVAITESVSQTI
jgi:flagellar motor switch protein FliM